MLTPTQRFISVQARFVAFHYWSEAPDEVKFLRWPHRHEFHVKATLRVTHNERQLEFFMVQDDLKDYLDQRWKGSTSEASCETMAQAIAEALGEKWGEAAVVSVGVSEDGENGAILVFERPSAAAAG